jgi:hypothetical protein
MGAIRVSDSIPTGLTSAEREQIDAISLSLAEAIFDIEQLGRHRSYSLAVTKLEEARHWLRDRLQKGP